VSRSQKIEFVIPARPESLIKLTELVENGDPRIDLVTQVVETDVSLFANTLATINNPLFRLRSKVTSVNQAVRILGVQRILTIVRMAALRSSLGSSGRLDLFWEESTLTAMVAGQLTNHFQFMSRDDAYMLGMMSSCGVPLMFKECEGYKQFYEDHSLLDPAEARQKEVARFHIDHYRLSGEIARSWGMPEAIAKAIALQPHYQDVLDHENYDEQVRDHLALLLLAREFSMQFSSPNGLEESYQPVHVLEPMLEQLCLTRQDINSIQASVFNSLQ